MIKVTVEGRGTFEINVEKVGELLGWLSNNKGVKVAQVPVQEVVDNEFTGRTLIVKNTSTSSTTGLVTTAGSTNTFIYNGSSWI